MSEKVKFEVDVNKQMGIARFELPNDAAQQLRAGRYRVTMKPVGEEAEEEPELKPCPFCGGEANAFTLSGDYYTSQQVCCEGCSACGPAEDTCRTAIDAWNRRTP